MSNFNWLFNAQVAHVVQAFAEQLKRARDQVTRVLGQQNDPERLSALKQLSEELHDAMHQIATAGRQADSSPVDGTRQSATLATDKSAPKDKCAFCEHLTAVIFQFMREYPYRLLKDPAERSRNAERGGMCSFHTWMYESTSSPQGICAGYAPVLLHKADRLDEVVNETAEMPDEIKRRLRDLVNGSDRCIACQLVHGAYVEKVGEIAADAERLEATTLCLPHLCSVLLDHAKTPDRLKAIGELANRLRRLGEDMQQFALKQSGLCYGWTSSGEKAAYVNGLRMVAAARPISCIKQIVEIGT